MAETETTQGMKGWLIVYGAGATLIGKLRVRRTRRIFPSSIGEGQLEHDTLVAESRMDDEATVFLCCYLEPLFEFQVSIKPGPGGRAIPDYECFPMACLESFRGMDIPDAWARKVVADLDAPDRALVRTAVMGGEGKLASMRKGKSPIITAH